MPAGESEEQCFVAGGAAPASPFHGVLGQCRQLCLLCNWEVKKVMVNHTHPISPPPLQPWQGLTIHFLDGREQSIVGQTVQFLSLSGRAFSYVGLESLVLWLRLILGACCHVDHWSSLASVRSISGSGLSHHSLKWFLMSFQWCSRVVTMLVCCKFCHHKLL